MRRSDTAARRTRRGSPRPRRDLLGAPHRQPLDVPRWIRDVRRGDENIPPHLSHRNSTAAGSSTLSLPNWHWALLRLAANGGPERPLPHLPDRFGALSRLLCSGPHGFGVHFRTDVS